MDIKCSDLKQAKPSAIANGKKRGPKFLFLPKEREKERRGEQQMWYMKTISTFLSIGGSIRAVFW